LPGSAARERTVDITTIGRRSGTDVDERRRVLAEFVSELNQRHDPARIGRTVELENWVAGSPLFAVRFE
jgi:hypothetical protein